MEKFFFELLQVAVGNRKSLTHTPTEDEWGELYTMATRQALIGVCFVGVHKLTSPSYTASVTYLPKPLRLKWLGMAVMIQQRNRALNSACVELVKQYTHDGVACCILKGQGNLDNYPDYLKESRTPGDIDVWCKTPSIPLHRGKNDTVEEAGIPIAVCDLDGKGAHYEKYHGKQAVIEYVKMLHRIGGTVPHEGVRYHHIDAPSINGVEVEAHFRPLFLDSPIRRWRLQKWFEENEQFGIHDTKIGDCVFPTPTVSFNAVYQLCHIYRHLFDEGIGLRQLLDYYFVLRSLHIEQGEFSGRMQSMDSTSSPQVPQWAEGMGISVKSNAELMHTISRLGMKKFASAVMFVLQEVFAMPSEYLICDPDEKEGKFLLNEIMQAGNFGKYDDRIKHDGTQFSHAIEKTKHNLRLLRHYPEEVMWEPLFRVYHWIWRRFELWRY